MAEANFENRLFSAGQMDLSTSPEFVQNGKYGYAFNIRSYDPINGSVGVVTNVEGNELVSYTFSPEQGAFLKVVGSRLDLKRRRVYWMIFGNTSANIEFSYVLYYDYVTQEITTVFSSRNVLEFSPENLIRKVDIQYDDAIGDTLFWTDGVSEPKQLNVLAGVNRFNNYLGITINYPVGSIAFADILNPFEDALLTLPFVCVNETTDSPVYDYTTGAVTESDWEPLSIGECYPPFLFAEMFYQKPITPYFPPNAAFTYADENTSPATNLSGKTYQFRYKYVYFTGQESEWSPISEAVASLELTSGVFDETGDPVVFDYPTPESVLVRVPISITRTANTFEFTEQPHSMISRVRVAVREVPNRQRPTDWLELVNIPIEDFFRYDVSSLPISTGFPIAGSAGTYFYNWDTLSYAQTDEFSRVVTITVPYTARETLIPVDVIDSLTNFYPVPNSATTEAIINGRMVWGGVSQGMDVSAALVRKMADELSFTVSEFPTEISLEQQTTNIISWNPTATSTSFVVGSGTTRTATWVFDLDDTLDPSDFANIFNYNFSIKLRFPFVVFVPTFLEVNIQVSGTSAIPSINSTFKELIEEAVGAELGTGYTVTVNNTTGEMTIVLVYSSTAASGTPTGAISTKVGFDAFFTSQSLLPERSEKNHSDQQFGFSFMDNAGRLTPVITGDWASINVGHFINYDLEPVRNVARIGNLSAIDVPQEARVMYILRKRSGSYDTFMNFALSRGNCPTQSWNFKKAFHVGLLNLDLDDFGAGSFDTLEPKYLYITPNSMTGEDGGSYGSIFKRRKQSNTSSRVDAARAELAAALVWKAKGTVLFGRRDRIRDRIERAQLELSRALAAAEVEANQPTTDPLTADTNFSPRLTPQAGDIVRFLYRLDTDGDIIQRYEASFIVLDYSEVWNTIVLDFSEIELKEPALAEYFSDNNTAAEGDDFVTRISVEVIRPRTTSENEFYWETAAQFSCTNGSVDINPDRDAINLFGDSYMKLRGQFVNYDGGDSTRQNFIMIDPDYSDFFESNNVGEGRENAEVRSIQTRGNYYSKVQRDNLAIYSEPTIQETDRRQLGTVYDSNLIEADNTFGRIEYLDAEGDVLNIYQEDKRARVFSGRSIATELNGAERILATTSQAFSDIAYQSGVFGISQDGTSFAKAGYRKYYADSKRGAVYRESLDGITPISSVGMETYFKRLFSLYRNSPVQGIIRGFFDETFDEYILVTTYYKQVNVDITEYDSLTQQMTVQLPSDSSYFRTFYGNGEIEVIPSRFSTDPPFTATVIDNQTTGGLVTFGYVGDDPLEDNPIGIQAPFTEVAVFSEKTGGWTTFYSYNAEWGEGGIQSYHTFVDGQMYIHEFDNTDYNTFHGRQFPMSVEVHSNANPELTKYWLTCGIKTKAETVEISEITTSEDQVSYIPNSSFENREGTQWSPFYGDGEGEDIIEGDRLRGRWLKATVEVPIYEANEENVKIFSVVFNSKASGFTR